MVNAVAVQAIHGTDCCVYTGRVCKPKALYRRPRCRLDRESRRDSASSLVGLNSEGHTLCQGLASSRTGVQLLALPRSYRTELTIRRPIAQQIGQPLAPKPSGFQPPARRSRACSTEQCGQSQPSLLAGHSRQGRDALLPGDQGADQEPGSGPGSSGGAWSPRSVRRCGGVRSSCPSLKFMKSRG